MNHQKYIKGVLKRLYIEECKFIGTSLDVNFKLLKLLEEEFKKFRRKMKDSPYKAVVESIIYAIISTQRILDSALI